MTVTRHPPHRLQRAAIALGSCLKFVTDRLRSGYRGNGSHLAARRFIRYQLILCRWLLRRSVYQLQTSDMIPERLKLPAVARHSKIPVVPEQSCSKPFASLWSCIIIVCCEIPDANYFVFFYFPRFAAILRSVSCLEKTAGIET